MGYRLKLFLGFVLSLAMHCVVAQQTLDKNTGQGMSQKHLDEQGMAPRRMDHEGMDHEGMDHEGMDHEGMDHEMDMDRDGMVMHANDATIPKDCERISEDVEFDVKVGRNYAGVGYTFGYDQHEYRVPGCSRVTVTLTNEDDVRHQWMVHGLPRYLYPQGMFHLEVNGGKTRSGTFIVPSDDKTYLVHCDMSQHMEKGLKAQLVVGRSKTDLPSIPGISGSTERDNY